MKLNLRIKLIGGFIIILFLMVVVGGLGIYTSKTIQNRLKRAVEQDVKPANILGDVARRFGFIRSNSLMHMCTASIDDMDRYESEIIDWEGMVNTDLDNLENIFKDRATLDKLSEFRAARDTYLRIWREQVVPLSRANRDEETFTLVRTTGAAGTVAREAMYKLDELNNANVAAASHRLELAEQDFRKSQMIALAVILAAIMLGVAFAIKQSSNIAGAVNTVSKAARLVAAGDFDQRVTVKTGDEIESMADSFNTMTSNMKKMVEELQNEITERKLAEETLAASKAYTESIIQNFLDTLIVVDAKAKIKTVNPATIHLLGYTEEELIGQPVSIIFAEEEEEEVNRFFQFFKEPEKSKALDPKDAIRNKELNYKTKDGQLIPMSFNASVLTDEAGKVAGVVAGAKDITDIKKAEEAKRKTEENFRKVIENIFRFIPEGLLVFTDKLNLFRENKAFKDIINKYADKLNYTEQELTEIIIEQVKNRIINEDYAEIRIPQNRDRKTKNKQNNL